MQVPPYPLFAKRNINYDFYMLESRPIYNTTTGFLGLNQKGHSDFGCD